MRYPTMSFRSSGRSTSADPLSVDAMTTSVTLGPQAEGQFLNAYRSRGLTYAKTGMLLGMSMAVAVSMSLWLYDTDSHRATGRIVVYLSLAFFLLTWTVFVSVARQWAVRHYVVTVALPVVIGTGSMSVMYLVRVEDTAAPWTQGPAAIILVLFISAAFTRLPVLLLTVIAVVSCGVYAYCIARHHEPLFPASAYFALTVVGVWALARDIERRERTVFSQLSYVAAASAAKSRVLASVSHDLRQPLGALTLYLGLFESRRKDVEAIDSLMTIDRMKMCVQAMEGNLSRLLEIGRLQSSSQSATVSRVDVAEVLARLQSVYLLQAATSSIALKIELVDHSARWGRSDASRMFDVLSNLLHNALKFTQLRHPRGGGEVVVHASRVASAIAIKVSDNGPGIDATNQERIFEEYVQVGNSERDHRKGYGLGLAIVRQMLWSLPEHDVSIESALGAGSCFTVSLPCETDPNPDVRPNGEALTWVKAAEMKGRLVLLVEDDILMRDALAETLRSWGVEVEVAATLQAAGDLVKESDLLHDAIISDWRLPGDHSGCDVIDAVRSISAFDTQAIIITGEFSDDATPFTLPHETVLLRKPLSGCELHCALQEAFARNDAVRTAVAAGG